MSGVSVLFQARCIFRQVIFDTVYVTPKQEINHRCSHKNFSLL